MPTYETIQTLQKLAEKRFLGRCGVVGVGVTQNKEDELVFFLERDSTKAQKEILHWAFQHRVAVRFLVTGKFRTLNR